MPGFEEEALERARRMSHTRGRTQPKREEPPPVPEPEPQPTPMPPEPLKPEPQKPSANIKPHEPPNLLETLFQDKEKSLILMLLMLLMDGGSDPSLLFVLMYLLM